MMGRMHSHCGPQVGHPCEGAKVTGPSSTHDQGVVLPLLEADTTHTLASAERSPPAATASALVDIWPFPLGAGIYLLK